MRRERKDKFDIVGNGPSLVLNSTIVLFSLSQTYVMAIVHVPYINMFYTVSCRFLGAQIHSNAHSFLSLSSLTLGTASFHGAELITTCTAGSSLLLARFGLA